ncbi:hypothetical protein PIB30_085789 [Stylosanthes scabra]|uniref:Uncharacterized protein n=1 Tax=Stylosanthes scabra TaxID=79078 RepID=A0ABU6YUT7_9FABA|nr:hypothetical protein [Stylosanthes scabra]
MLVQPSKLHKQLANSAELRAQPLSGVHATNLACIQGDHATQLVRVRPLLCVRSVKGAQAPFQHHTLDSESEGRSKEENPERKLANTLRKMIGLRELDSDDSNLGFPYSTSSSSEEDDVLENDPGFWDYDDLDDWGTAEPAASSEVSCTSHPPPNHWISIMLSAQRTVHILSVG